MKKTLIGIILTLIIGGGIYYFSIHKSQNPMPKNPTITLNTTQGDIVIQLFSDKAPEMTKNFLTLAKEGKYDNTIFHRVIEGFMIQGGDYENFNGTGGKAYNGGTLDDEIASDLSHVRGMVSMANRGPDTNGSQFFIVHQDATYLDGNYSIFGQVTDGMNVVDAIAETDTDINDRPMEDIKINSVEIKE